MIKIGCWVQDTGYKMSDRINFILGCWEKKSLYQKFKESSDDLCLKKSQYNNLVYQLIKKSSDDY